MDNRVLPFVSKYQPCLEQLLCCSKQFTTRRVYNLKCKNIVYFRNTVIKVIDCKVTNCKKIMFKEGKVHRDDRDPETGFTFPAIITADVPLYDDESTGLPGEEIQIWYKEGKLHRDDKDPKTGLTLPAYIWEDGRQYWYIDGKQHRDDRDPETGLTLPAEIWADGTHVWYKEGERHRDDKDPETGLTLPAYIGANGRQGWFRKGLRIVSPTNMDD